MRFDEALYVEKVELYETLNAGAVIRICALDDLDQWRILWETDSPINIQSARIFSPPIEVRFLIHLSLQIKKTVHGV